MFAPLRHHGRDLSAFLLVLALAAALRFGNSGIVEYFHDDAMLASLAQDLALGGPLPLTGILSSTGVPNSPVSVFLLALPFSLSLDPVFAIRFVSLLNVAGAGLLWLLSRMTLGWRVALLAGLLYACNPWAILFSRKLWAQEMHTPLILLGMTLLLRGCWNGRFGIGSGRARWLAQALSLPILCFAIQMHFAALALLPAVGFALWGGRRRISASAIAIGLTLSIVIALPYFAGLSQTLASDPTRIADALGRSADRGFGISGESLRHALMLASGAGLEAWMAPDQAAEMASGYPLGWQALLILPLIMLGGFVAAWRRSRHLAVWLALWAWLPPAILLLDVTPAYIHYFVPCLPAMALLCGIGLDALLSWLESAWLRRALWAAVCLLLALQVSLWSAALDYVARQHIDYPGFTTPLAKLLPLRDRLRQANDVVMLSHGMSWNLHHEVAVWQTLLRADVPCVRTLLTDGYAVLPDHRLSVVIAPDAPPGRTRNLYLTESPHLFSARSGGGDYALHEWETAPAFTDFDIQPVAPQRFSNGVALTGYALERGEVALEWRLPTAQPGEDYQYSAQLFDAADAKLAQLDARFWHGRHFCQDDRLLTWGALDIDDSAAILRVALYKLGDGAARGEITHADVLDELGNPKGQSALIALARR